MSKRTCTMLKLSSLCFTVAIISWLALFLFQRPKDDIDSPVTVYTQTVVSSSTGSESPENVLYPASGASKTPENIISVYNDILFDDYDPALSAFVIRLYIYCLNKEPDAGGLNYWCEQLKNGSGASETAQSFIFSDEYLARHTSNAEYVTMLYKTLLGRDPQPQEFDDLLRMANYTNTREHIFNSIISGDEFNAFCNSSCIAPGTGMNEPDNSMEWQTNVLILSLCNKTRASEGLDPLTTREDMWRDIVTIRASELPAFWGHLRPDGRSCFSLYNDTGIYIPGYTSELIASGYSLDAERLLDLFTVSKCHIDIITDPNAEYMAASCVHPHMKRKVYYCLHCIGNN